MTKQQQKDEALKAYRSIRDPAYKAYRSIRDSLLKAYLAIREPAWEAYLAKCKEIDAQDDEDIKIIDGKRYNLIKE